MNIDLTSSALSDSSDGLIMPKLIRAAYDQKYKDEYDQIEDMLEDYASEGNNASGLSGEGGSAGAQVSYQQMLNVYQWIGLTNPVQNSDDLDIILDDDHDGVVSESEMQTFLSEFEQRKHPLASSADGVEGEYPFYKHKDINFFNSTISKTEFYDMVWYTYDWLVDHEYLSATDKVSITESDLLSEIENLESASSDDSIDFDTIKASFWQNLKDAGLVGSLVDDEVIQGMELGFIDDGTMTSSDLLAFLTEQGVLDENGFLSDAFDTEAVLDSFEAAQGIDLSGLQTMIEDLNLDFVSNETVDINTLMTFLSDTQQIEVLDGSSNFDEAATSQAQATAIQGFVSEYGLNEDQEAALTAAFAAYQDKKSISEEFESALGTLEDMDSSGDLSALAPSFLYGGDYQSTQDLQAVLSGLGIDDVTSEALLNWMMVQKDQIISEQFKILNLDEQQEIKISQIIENNNYIGLRKVMNKQEKQRIHQVKEDRQLDEEFVQKQEARMMQNAKETANKKKVPPAQKAPHEDQHQQSNSSKRNRVEDTVDKSKFNGNNKTSFNLTDNQNSDPSKDKDKDSRKKRRG